MVCAWEQQSDLNKQNHPEPSPMLTETKDYKSNQIEVCHMKSWVLRKQTQKTSSWVLVKQSPRAPYCNSSGIKLWYMVSLYINPEAQTISIECTAMHCEMQCQCTMPWLHHLVQELLDPWWEPCAALKWKVKWKIKGSEQCKTTDEKIEIQNCVSKPGNEGKHVKSDNRTKRRQVKEGIIRKKQSL